MFPLLTYAFSKPWRMAQLIWQKCASCVYKAISQGCVREYLSNEHATQRCFVQTPFQFRALLSKASTDDTDLEAGIYKRGEERKDGGRYPPFSIPESLTFFSSFRSLSTFVNLLLWTCPVQAFFPFFGLSFLRETFHNCLSGDLVSVYHTEEWKAALEGMIIT